MSASDSITKAKLFNPSSVTYRAPLVNKRGGKSVQCQLNGAPIVLQFPLMLTWGINERVDEQSGRVSYDMALQFEKGKSSSIEKFEAALKQFQDKVLDDAVSKSKDWFGKSKLSREVAEAMMYPILKHPKKKDGSGEPDYERSPTLKLKVPFWDGKYNIELYDMSSKATYLPLDTSRRMGREATPQGSRSPADLVPKASHVKGLLACTGLWMAGGRFGVTWKLVQACVRPPVRLVGSGQCHIADDSDDDEMTENLKKYDVNNDDSVDKTNKEEEEGPSFTDSEEDDEEEEEEEETEEKPLTPPPKKKKVVRRKKVVKKTGGD